VDRVKSYSWMLTVVMGIAITSAVNKLAAVLAGPLDPNSPPVPLGPVLIRFFIFLVLALRWTLGELWYLDKAFVSKPPAPLGEEFFVHLYITFLNFVLFVLLAFTVSDPPKSFSNLSAFLNRALLGGKQVSTFIWVLGGLLAYDFAWFLLAAILRVLFGHALKRVQLYWAALNFITLLLCIVVFIFYGWMGKELQSAELPILYIVLVTSVIDIACTVVETSRPSQWLSP
jgi:hypothetical protein